MSDTKNRLANFPITFFPAVMGLAGLALAWRGATETLGLSITPQVILESIAAAVFVALILIYTLKIIRHFDAVKTEFAHPVKANFFSAVSISLVLLASIAFRYSFALAQALFVVSAILHLLLTLKIFARWFFAEHFQNPHINPAWFVPVVGNILMPVVAVPLGMQELAWFFFSIGIVFWMVLLTIFMHRIFFFDALPPALTPTLFILIAPPAVGFVSYLALNGDVDNFARILYGVALFITLFLLMQAPRFSRLPFFLSWWAYSFPLSAITIASFRYYDQTFYYPVRWIAMVLLAFTTVLILSLLLRTLLAIAKQKICLPDT